MIVPSSIHTVLSNTIGRNKTGLQGVDDGVMAPETRSSASDRAQARNDDHVLEELYRREFGGLLRLAFSMTSSESASEEIVQDAFVKLQSAGNGSPIPPPMCVRRWSTHAARTIATWQWCGGLPRLARSRTSLRMTSCSMRWPLCRGDSKPCWPCASTLT